MDLFADHSDPVQSQPTQLLQHALAPAPGTPEHSREWGPVSRNQYGGNASDDLSADSMIPPPRASAPTYRLQELSSVESQNQNSNAELVADIEGSQKENATPASSHENKRTETAVWTRSSSPRPPSDKLPHKGSSDPFKQPHSPNRKGAKAISFQSPNFTTTGPRPVVQPTKSMPPIGNRYFRRSPSPPSQDSFGGPLSQDPAEQYLASTKQFNVPLSDLGETPTQEVIHDDVEPDVSMSDASQHRAYIDAAMREYEAQKASSRLGHVLVAATPSHSGDSAGSSQAAHYTKINTDDLSQESTQPFDFDQTPSSFDRLLDKELADHKTRTSVPEPDPEPTQPVEFEPTQPNLSVEVQPPTTISPTVDRNDRQKRSATPQWVTPIVDPTVASTNPRSLLRLVNPNNKYRIAELRRKHGDLEPPSFVATSAKGEAAQTQHSRAAHTPAPAPPIPPDPTHEEMENSHQDRHGDVPPETDAFDIVPDSEPLRAGPSASSRKSPSKRPFRPLSPLSEHGSGELVPDSYEAEEPSDSDEGDVPLAAKANNKRDDNAPATPEPEERVRSLRKPRSMNPPKTASKGARRDAREHTQQTSDNRMLPRGKKNLQKEYEIPSSAPEQDLQDKVPSTKRPSTKYRVTSDKKRSRETSSTSVPPPARARPTVSKKRVLSSDTESSEEWAHLPTEDDEIVLPKARKEEEEETELVDDYDVKTESPPPAAKTGPSRKRRRIEGAKLRNATSKTSTRSKQSETPVPAAMRSVKRLRSGLSSNRAVDEPATRVLALWKPDGHYYCGTVHAHGAKGKYVVKFDDGTEDEVELKNMRLCQLVIGDKVILVQDDARAKVSDVSELESRGVIQVEVDDGADITTSEVDLRDIRVAGRSLHSQWKDRTLTADAIVTRIRPKHVLDTTPSRLSLASSVCGKGQRQLVKTGFVVTLTPKNNNPDQAKENAVSAIRQHGGLVIDDWSSVFTMTGKHSQANRHWVATPGDFRWKSDTNVDRVFLLSDDAHQKPKFLLALALGIPCLSFEWLSKPSKFSSDWQPFLLSAGYSDTLEARISQLVDLDWGNCVEHLTDIMDNRVAPKPFSKKSILCVGPDLVPLPPQRNKKNVAETERSREASRVVPWIILCMGASKVEAVTEVKHIPGGQMNAFDYIIVKDEGEVGRVPATDVVVRDVGWVKDCLISSRIVSREGD